MATRRTKEEKLKLIADYEESSLSLSEWCATKGISKSTFAIWFRSRKADVSKPKSKAKEKLGVSSEKVNSDPLSLFDLFNEAETLREPINIEPELKTVVKAHSRKKSKCGSKFDNLPVEVIEHKLDESKMICDVCSEPLTVIKKKTRR